MHKLQITYEQLLETIQEGIWVFDADANTTFVNPKMAKTIGYDEDEMIGKSIFDFMDEKVVKNVKKRIEKRKSGISETYEEKLKHKDGRDVYVEIKATPIIDDEGNYNGGIAGINDISDRKQAEEALKESEERNSAILSALPDLMFIYSRDGYYLDYHASDQSLLAVEPEQFLGKSVLEVLPQKVAEMFLQGFERVYETNELQIIDYLLEVPDGQKHFEARIASMDEQRLIVIIRDITEQKEREKQLWESEEIVRGIVDSAPYSIQLLDPEGYTVKVNEAFIELFGSTPPKDYTVLNDPHFETSNTHKNKMSLLAKGERVHFPETYYNTKLLSNHLPDKPLWIRADGFPLFDRNGKVKNLV